MSHWGGNTQYHKLASGLLVADATNIVVILPVTRRMLQIRGYVFEYTAIDIARLRFNNDTGTNYSANSRDNNTGGTSVQNVTAIRVADTAQDRSRWFVVDILNLSTAPKIVTGRGVSGRARAQDPQVINEFGGVWENNAQVTTVTLNGGANGAQLKAGSFLEIWGSD